VTTSSAWIRGFPSESLERKQMPTGRAAVRVRARVRGREG